MKKYIPIILALCTGSFAFADRAAINKAVEDTVDAVKKFTPQNASMLVTQPEAYIEKLFPSFPPHFTAGIAVSGTFLKSDFITDAVTGIQDSLNETFATMESTKDAGVEIRNTFKLPDLLPMPSAAVTARLGGIGLPFDLGAFGMSTFNLVNDLKNEDYKVDFNFTTFGFDLRFQILQEGILAPNISLGGGYIYSSHSFSASGKINTKITYKIDGSDLQADTTIPASMNINIKSHSLYAQAQISKKILAICPFIGGRLFVTASEYDYDWAYKAECEAVTSKGVVLPSGNSKDSSKSSFDFNKIQPQIFAGLGITTGVIQWGLDAAWNPLTSWWTAAVQLNFKL